MNGAGTDPFRILDLRGVALDASAVAPAADHVAGGGILVYPTETVYGLGAAVTPEGVAALRAGKGRDAAKPFLALIRSAADAASLLWTSAARELTDVFWPGAVTLVLADPSGMFPEGVRSPDGTVAVRVSPHPVVRALLDRLGGPLLSTSANAPGGPPARSGHEAAAVARGLGGTAEILVIDGGTLPASAPSTIVDCTGPVPVIVRQGSVPTERLRCVLPEIHAPTTD
ncbi:MAG: L-threonylcarbamoyladenylate synthase [Longimicrobiales bacterium]